MLFKSFWYVRWCIPRARISPQHRRTHYILHAMIALTFYTAQNLMRQPLSVTFLSRGEVYTSFVRFPHRKSIKRIFQSSQIGGVHPNAIKLVFVLKDKHATTVRIPKKVAHSDVTRCNYWIIQHHHHHLKAN